MKDSEIRIRKNFAHILTCTRKTRPELFRVAGDFPWDASALMDGLSHWTVSEWEG